MFSSSLFHEQFLAFLEETLFKFILFHCNNSTNPFSKFLNIKYISGKCSTLSMYYLPKMFLLPRHSMFNMTILEKKFFFLYQYISGYGWSHYSRLKRLLYQIVYEGRWCYIIHIWNVLCICHYLEDIPVDLTTLKKQYIWPTCR